MAGIKSIISSRGGDSSDDNGNDGAWLTKQIDLHLENPIFENRKDSKGVFYASGLGNTCDRALFLLYHGLLPQSSVNAQLQRIFDHGHSTEARFRTYFERMRAFVADEVPARIEHPPIHGRADFILTFPRLGIKRLILELKTINDNGFGRLVEPKPEHTIQLQCYLNILNYQQGIVLYENKNNQNLKSFYLEKDENIFKDIIARCRRIQRMEELPDIESVKHDRWCSCVNYNG